MGRAFRPTCRYSIRLCGRLRETWAPHEVEQAPLRSRNTDTNAKGNPRGSSAISKRRPARKPTARISAPTAASRPHSLALSALGGWTRRVRLLSVYPPAPTFRSCIESDRHAAMRGATVLSQAEIVLDDRFGGRSGRRARPRSRFRSGGQRPLLARKGLRALTRRVSVAASAASGGRQRLPKICRRAFGSPSASAHGAAQKLPLRRSSGVP